MRAALLAEYRKLVTTRIWWLMLVVMVVKLKRLHGSKLVTSDQNSVRMSLLSFVVKKVREYGFSHLVRRYIKTFFPTSLTLITAILPTQRLVVTLW